MDIIQKANEKLMILTIIIGFLLGIYLGIGHNVPNLWLVIVQWVIVTAVIMTVIATLVGIYSRSHNEWEELNKFSILRIFVLNLAVIAVCASFGFLFCSIVMGTYGTLI